MWINIHWSFYSTTKSIHKIMFSLKYYNTVKFIKSQFHHKFNGWDQHSDAISSFLWKSKLSTVRFFCTMEQKQNLLTWNWAKLLPLNKLWYSHRNPSLTDWPRVPIRWNQSAQIIQIENNQKLPKIARRLSMDIYKDFRKLSKNFERIKVV